MKLKEAEIEALASSWVWRLARPFFRVEREIRRAKWRGWHPGLRARLSPSPSPSPEPKPSLSGSVKAAPAVVSSLGQEPDTFVLYRILGNDLEPRHRKGQTRTNLALILAHEPSFENCEKRWLVNRIVDPAEEAVILDLLDRNGQVYTRIPFDLDEYARIGWASEGFSCPGFFMSEAFEALGPELRRRADVHARRLKNIYVMNNNGARNTALEQGRSAAKWVLPWDGNCFLTENAWREITRSVTEQAHLKYFVVPMLRVADNATLLQGTETGRAEEEPQLIFRRDSIETFDETRAYGNRPKVELLRRLGVPGPWDNWKSDPWEMPMRDISVEAGQFAHAGWVGRLESGQQHLERPGGATLRGQARADGISKLFDELDRQVLSRRLSSETLCHYDPVRVAGLANTEEERELRAALKADAEAALCRGPYSVTHKVGTAPSGNRNDYLSLARYWWPDPARPDGIPFKRRDGEDVFESGLPEFAPERFDRARLQLLLDDSIVLALAWVAHGDRRYLDHAANLIRTWFIEPETRMTPHLRFAQIVRGRDIHENSGVGVLDLAGIPRLLDAVRLLEQAGALSDSDRRAFRFWLRSYSDWLQQSPQGRRECRALNNHGTFYELQLAAIAAFLGDAEILALVLRRARERLPHQFALDGSQPQELARTRPAHYCHYNLVAWVSLAGVAESVGDDLWSYKIPDGRSLEKGLAWLLERYDHGAAPAGEIAESEISPIGLFRAAYIGRFAPKVSRGEFRPDDSLFRPDPLSGLPPYWQLLR